MSASVSTLRPKFEVEQVHNITVKKRLGKRATDGVTKGLVFEDTTYKLDTAWMVYFPAGHSILVESERELIRLGYMAAPALVDMETGEEVPEVDVFSPKEIVKRATQARRHV